MAVRQRNKSYRSHLRDRWSNYSYTHFLFIAFTRTYQLYTDSQKSFLATVCILVKSYPHVTPDVSSEMLEFLFSSDVAYSLEELK